MREIRFTERALSDIKQFIRSYEEGFFNLYKDSGIWAEDMIVEHYRHVALRLSNRIFTEIKLHLNAGIVLGRKKSEKWFELSFYIGDRLIIVYFSEDLDNKLRWIESVSIDRKPIIF